MFVGASAPPRQWLQWLPLLFLVTFPRRLAWLSPDTAPKFVNVMLERSGSVRSAQVWNNPDRPAKSRSTQSDTQD